MAGGSKKAVIAAFIGNGLIAISKFAAGIYTGSSAMISEAIHSVADTGNQALLLYGMKRSEKPADAKHPFGYGREIYFWAFVVAILLFAVGAGFSIYEGIHKIMNPEPMNDVYINYIVLSAAILFEGWAWTVAFLEFQKRRRGRSFLTTVQQSKDPALFTVLFEDTAALVGLVVAITGIYIAQESGIDWIDGATSVFIGVILALVAVFLAYETKGLLIGEGAHPEVKKVIEDHANAADEVVGVNEILTLHFGPEDVLLNISLDFKDDLNAGQVEKFVSAFETKIKTELPQIKRIFIEAQASSNTETKS